VTGVLAFLGVAALLVLSPGPTLAVVTRNAASYGRNVGLATAAGIGVANATHATAAALGLALVLGRSPGLFTAVRLAGAMYLAVLGLRSLWRLGWGRSAGGPGAAPRGTPRRATPAAGFGQGVLTNLLHPSVAVFYLSYIPQFIQPSQAFLPRYALLASIHVALSTGWMSTCAVAIDRLSALIGTPVFARTVEALACVSLVALGLVTAVG
jgi:threonine/homoserine/homoserine lactone efflux protein